MIRCYIYRPVCQAWLKRKNTIPVICQCGGRNKSWYWIFYATVIRIGRDYGEACPRIPTYVKKKRAYMYSFVRLKPVSGYASPLALLPVLDPLVALSNSSPFDRVSARFSAFHRILVWTHYDGTRRGGRMRFHGATKAVVATRHQSVAKRFKIEGCWIVDKIVRGAYLHLDVMECL